MRAELSTIQQTLTPEAAAVLSQSIAEASRRNHGQTTPLHVAAALLAAPSGFLRQACIRSHPNSSHPLQCRALDLCFSVALERLPTAQSAPEPPPVSNALMAALKRAQANQRRGCPEQQTQPQPQPPLLAVKVELDQLIISILDDPSVSRVMREASFSSPAVKATVEHSMNTSTFRDCRPPHGSISFQGIGSRPVFNPYLHPQLHSGGPGDYREDEVKRVLEIMSTIKKRNPVLIGDSEPIIVAKELLRKLARDEVWKNVAIISMEKGHFSNPNGISEAIKQLEDAIASRIGSGGVVLDLGDLKWLMEHSVTIGGQIVAEMAKLLVRFNDRENKLWLTGTATCETYLRCQVYHSTMENDWDVQVVPMASRSHLPGMFPRPGSERLIRSPVVPLNPVSLARHASENSDPGETATLCPQCSENYGKELAKLTSIEKSFSEVQQGSTRPSLPQWLQNAKLSNATTADQSQKAKGQELHKKWRDTCLHIHPNFHHSNRPDRPVQPTAFYDPKLFTQPMFLSTSQPAKPLGQAVQLTASPPESPVRTDLVLGRKGTESAPKKDFLGCISSKPWNKLLDKFANVDTYKKLLKGLMENAWWQAEAACAVASAVTRCRLGSGKHQGAGSRGDGWLLFMGPDRVGKKKMASVLAEHVCGASPVTICLGKHRDDEESDGNYRGKTAVDRIAEAVQRNPFSVIMLEDVDEADVLVRGSIKWAIERGRLMNSHGREVGLGNAIFILTGDWSTRHHPDALEKLYFVEEKKLASVSGGNWELGLIVREKSAKRLASWLHNDEVRLLKPRRDPGYNLSLDLNLVTGDDDDKTDGSNNSSDLTIDHEDELNLVNSHLVTSVPTDLLNNVDDSIMFKPVDLAFIQREIKKTISSQFSMIMGDELSLEVGDDVLEKIYGGLRHDQTSLGEWTENILAPSFDRLNERLPPGNRSSAVVHLVIKLDSSGRRKGDGLPSSIFV